MYKLRTLRRRGYLVRLTATELTDTGLTLTKTFITEFAKLKCKKYELSTIKTNKKEKVYANKMQ